jgi:hypothetical protein
MPLGKEETQATTSLTNLTKLCGIFLSNLYIKKEYIYTMQEV